MAEESTDSVTTKKSQAHDDTVVPHQPRSAGSLSRTLAGRLANAFVGLTLWDGLIILSVLIALGAFLLEWQRGVVLEYFRQGRPFDRFALVLIALVFLPQQLERFKLPAMLGLILGGVLVGPYGLALAPKVGEV